MREATESWSRSGEVTRALRRRALAAGCGLTTTSRAYTDLREVVSGSASQGGADTFQLIEIVSGASVAYRGTGGSRRRTALWLSRCSAVCESSGRTVAAHAAGPSCEDTRPSSNAEVAAPGMPTPG